MWLGGIFCFVGDLAALWLLCGRVFLLVGDLVALWLAIVWLGHVLWLFVEELIVLSLLGILLSATV